MPLGCCSIQINGEGVTRTTIVKLMRRAKRDVLNLIDTFVSKSNNPKVCLFVCLSVCVSVSLVCVCV